MGSKKQTTVFRQLILNIVIPLILSVVLFSAISYYYNKQKLEADYTASKMRIMHETKDLLALYDYSLKMHEEQFSKRMHEVSEYICTYVKNTGTDPAKLDLSYIVRQQNLDTMQHAIYILDTPCVIVNTTFKRDLGLDFKKLNAEFPPIFDGFRKGKKYVEDRFSDEMSTGKIKKYSYQPMADGRYVLELGFYSDEALNLRKLLFEKVKNISAQYTEMKSINLIMGIINARNNATPPEDFESFNECLKKKSPVHVERAKENAIEYVDFLYLDMINSTMFDGYVIQIISDNRNEKELVNRELRKFGFIFLVTVIPLIILIYFRARNITNPIKKLIRKVNVIKGGNLEERIEPEGRNEITELSHDFNEMVDKLQESYEGLEQKVKQRTAELEHQKELIEEKQKEILDSIKYAKRIQVALITSERYIEKALRKLNNKN